MDVTIQNREAFTVLGIKIRLNPMTADFKVIWHEQFMPKQTVIKALAIDDGPVAVYFATEDPALYDMIAGMIVPADSTAPENLVLRQVPAAQYVVATCAMKDIAATWAYLFEKWPQTSDYAIDGSKPGFEYYPPKPASEEEQASIWVPVLAK